MNLIPGSDTLKVDLINYIAGRTPALFFQRVVEEIESGHFDAHKHAETFDDPERFRIQPQLEHYRSSAALRKAADAAGMVCGSPHTTPKGEKYSLATSDGIRYGQVCLPFDNKTPRYAKHRKLIAALNARLEPSDADLFSNDKLASIEEGLGCLVVTVKPHKRKKQSTPFGVMVGVPFTNLRGWHLFVPVSEVMAAYHPSEQVEVPDLAFATLKRRMNDRE